MKSADLMLLATYLCHKFDQNYKIFGNNQAKVFLRFYEQTLSNFSITL